MKRKQDAKCMETERQQGNKVKRKKTVDFIYYVYNSLSTWSIEIENSFDRDRIIDVGFCHFLIQKKKNNI